VLIVVSDGGDNASRTTYAEVLDTALRRDVVIYAVGIFDADGGEAKPGILRELAAATGGEACFPRKLEDVGPALERIAHDIRSSYTIGYVPPERATATARRVRVDVHRPGRKLTIRARSAYVKDSTEVRRDRL
jgi:VWFA-related protein